MIDVSIIIVNYNTSQLTENCINSILNYVKYIEYEIIIVDNSSIDGSQNLIKSKFPQVKLIESKINLGFGRANNLGVKSANGKFLFFLNSDTILIENSVKVLTDFFNKFENELKIGALGAILVDEALNVNGFGSHFPTCKEESLKKLMKFPLIKRNIKFSKEIIYPLQNEYFEIDYIIGADLFIRKDTFENLNGFSEDYFMYYEESDLQNRLSKFQLNRYILTYTRIIHLEDGSGKSVEKYSNRKRIIVHQSKNIYLKKNDKSNYLYYILLDLIFLCFSFMNFKYSFRENYIYFKEVIKSY